jgi:hypothetical protein
MTLAGRHGQGSFKARYAELDSLEGFHDETDGRSLKLNKFKTFFDGSI